MINATTDNLLDRRFDKVMAAWSERIPCEAKSGGRPCHRPAAWHVDVHGCERKLICNSHFRDWERRLIEVFMAADGHTFCGRCSLNFDQLDGTYTARSL